MKAIKQIILVTMLLGTMFFCSCDKGETKEINENVEKSEKVEKTETKIDDSVEDERKFFVKGESEDGVQRDLFRGISYGMSKKDIEKFEENNKSFKAYEDEGYQGETTILYFFDIDNKYGLIGYILEGDKLVGLSVLANDKEHVDRFIKGDVEIPKHITEHLYEPKLFYDELYEEIVSIYGKPDIKSSGLVWQNEYEVVFGGMDDKSSGYSFCKRDSHLASETLKRVQGEN